MTWHRPRLRKVAQARTHVDANKRLGVMANTEESDGAHYGRLVALDEGDVLSFDPRLSSTGIQWGETYGRHAM